MTERVLTAAEQREVPGREELLRRARELTPLLRERAAATEANRKMLDENVKALIDAGFLRISQPGSLWRLRNASHCHL